VTGSYLVDQVNKIYWYL